MPLSPPQLSASSKQMLQMKQVSPRRFRNTPYRTTAYPDRRQRRPLYEARVSTLSGQWAELSPLTLGGGRAAKHKDSNSRSSGINVDRLNRSATDCLSHMKSLTDCNNYSQRSNPFEFNANK
ncbi:hypothetical protein TYRP_019995 [Tyrophagus putrescentiae]|nr:hypothetical protein TYRP_019995 [Tyrophagus putrescentiae]